MSTLSLGPPPVAAPQMAGPRPTAPATAIDSARAPRPVEAIARGDPLRNPSARERPVGPPPAFEVSVLEDLRERLLHAVETVASPPEPIDPPAQSTSEAADPAESPPLPHLDKKV